MDGRGAADRIPARRAQPCDRQEHASIIRHIFERYIALGCARSVALELQENDILVPRRETATGRSIGGGFFSRRQVYKILANPTYVGEIHHHGKVHAGNHPAIIERETWERAQ